MAANAEPLRLLLKSKLRVKVHRAQGLVSKNKQGFNSTSIRLKIGEKVQDTEVAEKQRAPVWSQSFDFLVPDQDSHLLVTAYHHRRLKKDFLGRVRIAIKDILSLHTSTKSSSKETMGYLFRNKANLFDKDRGEVCISFDFVPIDFSVPSDPGNSNESFAFRTGSKKDDLLTSDTPLAYSSLTRSKSLRVKSRSRPNLSSRDFTKQSFDWTEARVLRKENLARKAKYQEDEKWANSGSETSASAVDSSTIPNSCSDSDFDGEGSLSEFSDYAPTSEVSSGVIKNRRLDCLDFVPQPLLQRGSPDGSCCSIKPKEQQLASSTDKLEPTLSREGLKFSPNLSSSKRLSRSTSAISVRAPSKTSQALLKPVTAKLTTNLTEPSPPSQRARVSPAPPQETPATVQSAVITGRRSMRKISRKASNGFTTEEALPTPRQEMPTDNFSFSLPVDSPAQTEDQTPLQRSVLSPVNTMLRSEASKLSKAEDSSEEEAEPAWNLSSFSSEDADTATELRKNSKQTLIHMLLKQKQEFSQLQRDQLETKRYLDELLAKIIIHCPDLLSKNS